MELIKHFFDLVLHLDKTLVGVVQDYGTWTYLILFLIVFTETGVIVFPFLPGDSLLFVAGTLAAQPNTTTGDPLLNVWVVMPLLIAAAFIGDNVNYMVGDFLGPRVFREDFRFLKRKYLDQTQAFYAKHGGKTIIMARFVPIVRTFAPFVAGVGTMTYRYFASYSIFGAAFWVISLTLAGYFFGNIEWVQKNFTIVIYAIILVSVLPPLVQFLKEKLGGKPADSKEDLPAGPL
ncbi:DedA family protein [Hymenobacter saemangeumensis]|uniref:DedA family protein n=1 Tax=Hymenobacter saemangeumensis TaxID=1084522 RepID=A0ABP8IDQ8_9BACT